MARKNSNLDPEHQVKWEIPVKMNELPRYDWLRLIFAGAVSMLLFASPSASAGGNGTLLILRNATNIEARLVSLWGGGGSEQIIMKSDGTVWDWGLDSYGQLGNGTSNHFTNTVPFQVLGPSGAGHLTNLAAIMGGEQHNFALEPDGTVWAWGMNYFGQLGDDSTNWGYFTNYSATPVEVFGLTSVKSLGGRGYHSLALKNDGTIWTWGCNRDGELGIGVAYDSGSAGYQQGTNLPVQVVGLTNPASLSGGGFFSLALMSNGTVMAWGENDAGECGNGTNINCPLPVQVVGLSNIAAISGGWMHTLALMSNGTVWSWGQNPNGELGDGTTNTRYSPVQVTNLSNVVAVSTGDGNSMARTADGTVWKWGVNQFGELGNGTSDDGSIAHPIPMPVAGLSNIAISVNRDYHNICVRRDGTVWVWGDNRWGGCGDASGNPALTPRLMSGLVSNNLLPYADSFEAYANGSSLVGTNSWYSDDPAAATVVVTNDSYSGPFPIPGAHAQMLSVSGTVTNRFCPSFYTNVWLDMILQASRPTNPAPELTDVSFAVCLTTNGQLAVWNCTNPPAAGNGWTTLNDVNLGKNEFFRLTIGGNYAPGPNGIFYYNIWVNGLPSMSPATKYAAADSSQPWLGEMVASGNFLMDDLVVATNKPFYALQTEVSAFGGAISPAGPVIVDPGSTNTFTMTASNWYALASVAVDGANVGTPASYTFTNVLADHTIVANYAPLLAAHETPEWWLYQYNTNWATNFDAAALGDQDGDGVPTWQEFIAGTNPTNAASVFALSVAPGAGQTVVSLPTIATTPQYQLQRYYALQFSTDLTQPWQTIPGWTNIQGQGQILTYTNTQGASNVFYRGQVWLGP
jgi:alpha-tubulin suppressor-like RCC1 family protein